MPLSYVNPIMNGRTGTLDPSTFSRTGSAYTNPDFLKIYLAQIESQSFNTLFGEEGLNDSIFGTTGLFDAAPSSTSTIFGGLDQSTLPSDISGLASTGTSASLQYMELIMNSYLVGKTVEIRDPATGNIITGKVNSISQDNGALLLDVDGKKIPPEYLIKISS